MTAKRSPGTTGSDEIRERLEALDHHTQDQLAVLALVNEGLSSREWAEHVERHGVAKKQGSTPEQLVALGLLTHEYGRGKYEYAVGTVVALTLLELLHEQGRLAALAEHLPPARKYWRSHERLATDLRLAVLDEDEDAMEAAAALALNVAGGRDLGAWTVDALGLYPTSFTLRRLPAVLRACYFGHTIPLARKHLLRVSDELLELGLELPDKALRLELGRLMVLRGQGERARALDKLPKYGAEGLSLLAAFWSGDYAEAARIGGETIAAMKTRKRKGLPDLEGACHVLASLATSSHDPRALSLIEATLVATGKQKQAPSPSTLAVLESMRRAMMGDRSQLRSQTRAYDNTSLWMLTLVSAVHDLWFEQAPQDEYSGADTRDEVLGALKRSQTHALLNGYDSVARELEAARAALASPTSPTTAGPGDASDDAQPSLAAAYRAPSPWEAALTGLEAIAARHSAPAQVVEHTRHLVWELTLYGGHGQLQARLRTSPRSRKGKVVSLSRLLEGKVDCVSDEDLRVLAAAEPDKSDTHYGRPRRGGPRSILGPQALVALIGHPRVVDGEGQPSRVERGQARVRTHDEDQGEGVRVELEPRELLGRAVYCEAGEGCVRVYERTPELARAAEILGAGLVVPRRGLERLNRTLAQLSVSTGVTVEGDLTPAAKQIQADPRPLFLLGWDGETLTARARVAPQGIDGVHLKPGVGHPEITAQLREGGELRLLRCERDLIDERRRFAEVERDCATLMSYAEGPLDWRVPTLADALEVMLELGQLGDAIMLAWAKGKTLMPPGERDLPDLHIDVTSGQDWLEVAAALTLDEGRVLGYRQLIAGREGPRFVKLGEGRFLALSERLRRRIDALENLGAARADALRVTPAMLPVLEELTDDLDGVSFDAAALERLARIRELATAKPRRPRGFQAQLRDYQKDGYTWMWRLAEAGLGACLADDMGLGKTIQALALLSQRAGKGPALVVCPTSVVHNWIAESSRFAPGLRTVLLHDASDRAAALGKLRKRDLLVCSYGLLVSETEALAQIEFATAVFDEAHMLKNERTKRARAARDIQAGFRLGLSGTPVENRVDELWSLYAVLVPGLLGTKTNFDKRFAKPIARGDRERSASLRALLRHFILRRTKGQVLDELPPRTEITLRIQQTSAERAYYEALRQRAVDAVEQGDRRKKRFRILAQITRLRQAAVDPRLVDEAAAPAGAKIEALVEHVLALREEGHRALIFTQFLGSMALLRERLDATGVEYLELDGSTPAAERARRVEAFQGGEGDVFVLSLRAGGVGMNLTGADYVLHLDPWWNPAVEDQATDRAHRIGQTRPVTVYRLITEGTIEEKILALHESKRDLADDILTGLGGAEALDLDQLMGLLEGESLAG